jgi:hypothetical protein
MFKKKECSWSSGSFCRMAVLPAGVFFTAFVELKRGGKNSLAAFETFWVNLIMHAESPFFSNDQAN